jgi:tight adherence protein C
VEQAIMQIVIGILAGVFILGGFIFLIISLRWFFVDDVTVRMQTFISEDDDLSQKIGKVKIARNRELTGSLISRAFLPIFKKIGQIFSRFTPATSIDNLQHQLYIAGNPMGMGPREFYGIRLIFSLVGVGLAYLIIQRSGDNRLMILAAILMFVFCLLFPILWLRLLVQKRQNKIRRGFPDALDMLSVCASAGLGFDQSLQRVSEYWKTAIAVELGRVVTEMEMGLSRRQALRNFADRLDVSELSSFVAIILQSEQLGMSISDTLHSQADQMRVERHYRAEELARKAPIKMLLPLAFLIFPAILAVLLAPSIPPLLSLFNRF